MSNARPKRPTPWMVVTPRQRRRYARKYRTFVDVVVLHVMDHGGSGVRVRKPLLHNATPTVLSRESCSLVTHVAYHCKPCKDHTRPRLHRVERAAYYGVTP